MRRRNPDPTRASRRSSGLALPVEVRRRRLWRRFGWPRGFVRRGVWFLGVDVTFASDLWVARVHALPPRPRGGPASPAGVTWLAALDALQAHAAVERAAAAGRRPAAQAAHA